jgi:hypothetical protein
MAMSERTHKRMLQGLGLVDSQPMSSMTMGLP